jgi:protein-L-isoaspartate(D-aspartate) O-methyltransferase
MTWGTAQRTHAAKRAAMVERQLRARGIRDERVLDAMSLVPRQLFVPPDLLERAYDDVALPIGFEQTISQPYIVALILEALELEGDERVLDVGTGSGYQAALMGMLAREVYSVEIVPELVSIAEPCEQTLYSVRKSAAGLETRAITPCAFVPLVGKRGF